MLAFALQVLLLSLVFISNEYCHLAGARWKLVADYHLLGLLCDHTLSTTRIGLGLMLGRWQKEDDYPAIELQSSVTADELFRALANEVLTHTMFVSEPRPDAYKVLHVVSIDSCGQRVSRQDGATLCSFGVCALVGENLIQIRFAVELRLQTHNGVVYISKECYPEIIAFAPFWDLKYRKSVVVGQIDPRLFQPSVRIVNQTPGPLAFRVSLLANRLAQTFEHFIDSKSEGR